MGLTEVVTWTPVAAGLPDSDLTVQVALTGHDEPTWLGYFDGEGWIDIEGMPLGDAVTHWAEMPKGPAT
jgi:hypothetical protein